MATKFYDSMFSNSRMAMAVVLRGYMPFRSKAQERYAFANPEKFGGKKNILEEWMKVTPRNLPERVGKKKSAKKKD